MRRHRRSTALSFLVAAMTFTLTAQTHAQAGGTLYPRMAPLGQYLMASRKAEIALARSAAPASISRDAKVLVLGPHGYETAVDGKNGFVCLVERSWMSPLDSAEFWNPRIRGPICYNPPALGSFLPVIHKRTQMALAGSSKVEIGNGLQTAFARGELRAPQPGAMSYMMSKRAYLTDEGSHNMAHLMIYTPIMRGAKWGADLPDSPVMVGIPGSATEPYTEFLIAVGKWSDGTPAQSH